VRTPRSTPTGPPPARRASAGCGAGNATCQRPARSTVTRAMPRSAGRARVHWNRTHPHFGTCTSPQRRVTRRTLVSRITNPCRPRLLRYFGLPAGLSARKNAATALSKSRSACCCTADEPSRNHGSAARAAASCRPRSALPGAAPRPGHHHDCCSTARFHTNRASSQWRERTPTCAAAGYSRFLTATAGKHIVGLRQPTAATGVAGTRFPPPRPPDLRDQTPAWRRQVSGQSPGKPRICRSSRKSVIVWSGTQPGWALVP
jgi:hypothetical protein